MDFADIDKQFQAMESDSKVRAARAAKITIEISEEDVYLVSRVAYEQRINAMNTTDTYALRELSQRLCAAKRDQIDMRNDLVGDVRGRTV